MPAADLVVGGIVRTVDDLRPTAELSPSPMAPRCRNGHRSSRVGPEVQMIDVGFPAGRRVHGE
jgi:hypothetical protein